MLGLSSHSHHLELNRCVLGQRMGPDYDEWDLAERGLALGYEFIAADCGVRDVEDGFQAVTIDQIGAFLR